MTDSPVATAEESREPAPEPLEVVREFVNTYDVESGSEAFAGGAGVHDWFVEHELLAPSVRISPADRRRVIELREAIRALLLANNGEPLDPEAVSTLNAAAERAPLAAHFDPAGTIGVTGRRGGLDGALGQLMAVVLQAVADGSWSRLKACREHECQWAFYDRSRNRSGQWCVMAVCGNRNKARTYRSRQRS
jgi:predicted RNA-binding Zn ribbon-like protein